MYSYSVSSNGAFPLPPKGEKEKNEKKEKWRKK